MSQDNKPIRYREIVLSNLIGHSYELFLLFIAVVRMLLSYNIGNVCWPLRVNHVITRGIK